MHLQTKEIGVVALWQHCTMDYFIICSNNLLSCCQPTVACWLFVVCPNPYSPKITACIILGLSVSAFHIQIVELLAIPQSKYAPALPDQMENAGGQQFQVLLLIFNWIQALARAVPLQNTNLLYLSHSSFFVFAVCFESLSCWKMNPHSKHIAFMQIFVLDGSQLSKNHPLSEIQLNLYFTRLVP